MSQAMTRTTPHEVRNGRQIARKPKTMSTIAHTIDFPEPRFESPAAAMFAFLLVLGTTAYRTCFEYRRAGSPANVRHHVSRPGKATPFILSREVFSMPEGAGGSNIEVAHHLSEHTEHSESRAHTILEIVEAIVLAVVAVSTAWSGYQAALWTGHQAELYGLASKYRVEAEGAATTANQERLYNASTVVEWLKAEANGQKKLSDLFERRFLPEFRPAFEAWKKT